MGRTFIEGLPCAGKSTLVKQLEKDGHQVIHELGRVLDPGDFPGNGKTREEIALIDEWFIKKEAERLAKSQSGYFDRSYFTHLSYAYAYNKLTGIGAFEETIATYENAIEAKDLPLPDTLIYIDESADESIKRQRRRIELGHRALDSFWMDKQFLEDTRHAYEKIFESTLGINIKILNSSDSVELHQTKVEDDIIFSPNSQSINLQKYKNLMKN